MGSLGLVLRRYLIKVWYLGTNFAGSQRQPNKRTIEGELLHILKKEGYFQAEITFDFKAATRTDAGVHAYEALFAFSTEKPL